jgi:hypothetical protein
VLAESGLDPLGPGSGCGGHQRLAPIKARASP